MHGIALPHLLTQRLLIFKLSPMELDFLTTHASGALAEFEKVSQQSGTQQDIMSHITYCASIMQHDGTIGASEKVLKMASSSVERAQK